MLRLLQEKLHHENPQSPPNEPPVTIYLSAILLPLSSSSDSLKSSSSKKYFCTLFAPFSSFSPLWHWAVWELQTQPETGPPCSLCCPFLHPWVKAEHTRKPLQAGNWRIQLYLLDSHPEFSHPPSPSISRPCPICMCNSGGGVGGWGEC